MLRPQHAGYLCLRIRPLPAISDGAAAIAQLVEHIIRNDGVGGSNPSCGTSACETANISWKQGVKSRRPFRAQVPAAGQEPPMAIAPACAVRPTRQYPSVAIVHTEVQR